MAMIIKSYTASTVAEALKKIREELGGDAVVLSTKMCGEKEISSTGHRFEVTACIDQKAISNKISQKHARETENNGIIAAETPSAGLLDEPGEVKARSMDLKAKPRNRHHAIDFLNDIDDLVQPIFLRLADADLPYEIAFRITNRILKCGAGENDLELVSYKVLQDEVRRLMAPQIKIPAGSRPAFVGPSGSGKTSTLGKIAAQIVTGFHQKIRLMSIDNMKIAAPDEIGIYSRILNIPGPAHHDELDDMDGDTIVLVDTPAITHDSDHNKRLLKKIKAMGIDMVFFCFSTCSRTGDMIDAADIFRAFQPHYLIATHLDESRRWGGILAMAEYLNAPVALVSDGPGGIGGLAVPDPAVIAKQLLNAQDDKHELKSNK